MHTPGPWSIRKRAYNSPILSIEAENKTVATIFEQGNAYLNAHLIKATPDLLAACELISTQFGAVPQECLTVDMYTAFVVVLEAIAKAKPSND